MKPGLVEIVLSPKLYFEGIFIKELANDYNGFWMRAFWDLFNK